MVRYAAIAFVLSFLSFRAAFGFSVDSCLGCHGSEGEGNLGLEAPQLAGLGKAYFERQLVNFKTGNRQNAAMTGIVAGMSQSDMDEAAQYFSGLTALKPAATKTDQNKLELGYEIFEKGIWGRKIPACSACHGIEGEGIGSEFPRLSWQLPSYTEKQLRLWKTGKRKNDPLHLMSTIAKKLTNGEISAVASFLGNMSGSKSNLNASKSKKIKSVEAGSSKFEPPDESEIPVGEYGDMVRRGRDIFMNTQSLGRPIVGNQLNCVNCHLDRGRLPNSSPLWAAFGMYPEYRKKTKKVETLESRLRDCFRYSLNGKAPGKDDDVITALVTYQRWLSTGAIVGRELSGRGYPRLNPPPKKPVWEDGKAIYEKNCRLCHGQNGEGLSQDAHTYFPPLWGDGSYNWGAGMHRIDLAAGFIKANMPLGLSNTLTTQEAWDVAYYMNSHPRPLDPRMKGNDWQTADKDYHDENCRFGDDVEKHRLGSK